MRSYMKVDSRVGEEKERKKKRLSIWNRNTSNVGVILLPFPPHFGNRRVSK